VRVHNPPLAIRETLSFVSDFLILIYFLAWSLPSAVGFLVSFSLGTSIQESPPPTARNTISPGRQPPTEKETMRQSVLLVAALMSVGYGSPSYPQLVVDDGLPGSQQTVSDYFNLVASKVQQSRLMSAAPACDLSQAKVPLGEFTANTTTTINRQISSCTAPTSPARSLHTHTY
jgi:hypothetical protein